MKRSCRYRSARSAAVAAAIILVLAMTPIQVGAQVHGTLERMEVERPDGCSTRVDSMSPTGSGTFTFSYTCNDTHLVTFTASFPSAVEATPLENGSYALVGTANASASTTWSWTSPTVVPGGLLGATDLLLRLGTETWPPACAAAPVTEFDLQPGLHTWAAAHDCALAELQEWIAGEPGDTTPRASYWAEASFMAWDGLFEPMFPTAQLVRARAIYRMVSGPDLAVDIGGMPSFKNTPVLFPVTITNLGNQPSASSRLLFDIKNELPIETVTEAPSLGCTWSSYTGGFSGDCEIGSLAAGDATATTVEVKPGQNALQDVTMTAWLMPGDAYPLNDQTAEAKAWLDCSSDTGNEACPMAVLACYTATGPSPMPAPAPPVGGSWRPSSLRSLVTAARSLADSAIDLVSFWRLRDEVLEASAAGRRLRALYYTHGTEVAGLALANPDLAAEMVDGVLLWQPHVRALVDGNGSSAVITAEQMAALTGVLTQLKALAGPELRAALEREESAANLPALVGTTMTEALARVEAAQLHRRVRRQTP